MSEKIPEVYKAIAAIVNSTGAIPKTGYNDFHNYAYTREEDIVNTLKKQFEAHQVILLPNVTKAERVGDNTLINVEFTLMSLKDGSKHVFNVPGEGTDKNDKGTPKALTMAMKYALQKQFLVGSGDDAEADTTADARAYGSKSSVGNSARGSDDMFSRGTAAATTSDEDEAEEAPKAKTGAAKNSISAILARANAKTSKTTEETEESTEDQEDVLLSRAKAANAKATTTSEETEEEAEAAGEEVASDTQVTSKASDILAKWKNNKTKNTASLARRA